MKMAAGVAQTRSGTGTARPTGFLSTWRFGIHLMRKRFDLSNEELGCTSSPYRCFFHSLGSSEEGSRRLS
jgi:hypothetical protein